MEPPGPRRVQELRGRVRAAGSECASLYGREPSVQVAAHTGLTAAEVLLDEGVLESFTAVSLDAVPGRSEHSRPLTDTLGGLEPGFDLIVNREALRPLLRALPERERRIIYMRFFCAHDLRRTG
jgi:RNA polymerase sigma-B factor